MLQVTVRMGPALILVFKWSEGVCRLVRRKAGGVLEQQKVKYLMRRFLSESMKLKMH